MEKRRLRLGISTGSLYPAKDRVERIFAFAEAARLDGVEVICDSQRETHDEHHLRDLVERHGVPVLSLHAPFPSKGPEAWGSSAEDNLRATANLARSLHAEHVVSHLPDRFYLKRLAGLRIPLPSSHGRELYGIMSNGGLYDLEEATGVRICVENLPHQHRLICDRLLYHWNTLDDWSACHRHLTLDTTHWATKSVSPVAALEAGGDAIRHVHLSNYASRMEHLPPQFGSVDLATFLRRLAESRADRIVVIEPVRKRLPEADGELMMALRQAVAFCRGHLDQTPEPVGR